MQAPAHWKLRAGVVLRLDASPRSYLVRYALGFPLKQVYFHFSCHVISLLCTVCRVHNTQMSLSGPTTCSPSPGSAPKIRPRLVSAQKHEARWGGLPPFVLVLCFP